MAIQSAIFGCSGHALSKSERAFFRDMNPWGFILFKRNIDTPDQVRKLVDALRACTGRDDAPVLIDQEGGRVQRLGPPHWPKYPPGKSYGGFYKSDPVKGRELTRLGARLMAHDLRALGITVDCVPVLDVPVPGAHDIIGDRAYGLDASTVAILGRAASEGLLAGGVLPVIKHIPGHGRAGADSHEHLPVVDVSRSMLEKQDFVPFRHLADMPLAMTAHVVYAAIDSHAPATTSKTMIREIIRGHIGFKGLLMSDDLSMKALSGTFGERTRSSLKAGCDVVLHCNGDMAEMKAIAKETPKLAGKAKRRAEVALQRISHAPEPLDAAEARAQLDAALAALT
ncbi:MAG: beta-N-acetylhexosaminidase [Beijerinckiaceae bacterium]